MARLNNIPKISHKSTPVEPKGNRFKKILSKQLNWKKIFKNNTKRPSVKTQIKNKNTLTAAALSDK